MPMPMINSTTDYDRYRYYGTSGNTNTTGSRVNHSHVSGDVKGKDAQVKLCSVTCTTFSETTTRSTSMASSSDYDFLSTGGSACLLGPISVSSNHHDDITFDLHEADQRCTIESTTERHLGGPINTTATADGPAAVGQARIEDDAAERNAPLVELSEALPRDRDHTLRRPCGAEGDGDDEETGRCCGGACDYGTSEAHYTQRQRRRQSGYGSSSLAASDEVAVLAFCNGDDGGTDGDIVERDGEFPKVPDMISFANGNSNSQKNLTYTSLRDLLRCDVKQNNERRSVGVAENDVNPFQHVGDDDDSRGSIECHSSVRPCTIEQYVAELQAPHLDLGVTTPETNKKPEFPTIMDDDDYYRKTDMSITAELFEKISFENDMLLISEVGILKINDLNLDVCAKRVDSRHECACIVM